MTTVLKVMLIFMSCIFNTFGIDEIDENKEFEKKQWTNQMREIRVWQVQIDKRLVELLSAKCKDDSDDMDDTDDKCGAFEDCDDRFGCIISAWKIMVTVFSVHMVIMLSCCALCYFRRRDYNYRSDGYPPQNTAFGPQEQYIRQNNRHSPGTEYI